MLKTQKGHAGILFIGVMLAVLFFIAGQAPSVRAVTVTTDLEGVLVKGDLPEVYFVGTDNKRYVFPNEKVFFSWYKDFSTVRTITNEELAALPIGGNVTYRPGTRLVKIQSDPKVYAVGVGGALRWVSSETVAKQLFGDNWAKQVDDVDVSNFVSYKSGDPIQGASDYNPTTEQQSGSTIGGVEVPETASKNSNTGTQGSTSALKIKSVSANIRVVTVAESGISNQTIVFYVAFSQMPSGARLSVTEKSSGAVFYNEPINPDSAAESTVRVEVGSGTEKLKAKTVYTWKVTAYAAPNATTAQTAIQSGEISTIDPTVSGRTLDNGTENTGTPTNTPLPTSTDQTSGGMPNSSNASAVFSFCPVADNDLSQGCCATGGATFAKASATLTPGTLIKSESSSMVYYYASNGKRYVFTGKDVLASWYDSSQDLLTGTSTMCQNVKQISATQMGAITIGGNVDIRPGTYVVKIASDPKLYVISRGRTIRPLATSGLAEQIFPGTSTQRLRIIPDAYFVGYKIGATITSSADYSATAEYNWDAPNTMEQELGI